MGFATVFATIMFAFVFAGMIVFAAVLQKNMTESARLEHQRDQLAAQNSESEITIRDAAYEYNSTAAWKDDLYVDFAAGTTSATVVQATGTVTLVGPIYSANGSYTSQVIDTGVATPTYDKLSWTSVVPAQTTLHFQVHSADTAAALAAATFVGPDGTANTNYTAAGTAINTSHSGDRYFQYRAYLNTTDSSQTPQLQAASLTLARDTGVIYLNATNTGSVKLVPSATDIYVDGQRIARNATKRLSNLNDKGGQALWDPDEVMEFQVFRTLSGSAQITLANGPASDSTVVN